ncbi:MAG: leucine-rich repeat domain-containing protein [Segatella copri]
MRNFTLKGLFLAVVFMVLGSLSIQAADGDLITKQITIKLEEAGTLPSKIGDTKKYKITNLKIMGEINGTDLCFIREMAGSDREGWRTEGKLATLDLSGAKIVRGGGIYYNSVNCYTSDDVIGNYAFSDCSGLTSLILPSNVTSIGYSAFYGCIRLTSLTLPSSVTSIGSSAFEGCRSLTSLILPSSVTSIGSSAFYGCSGLTSLTLPSSVTSIGWATFSGCSGLTSLTLPSSVTSIDGRAFYGCSSLFGLTLPSSVTSIGSSAFEACYGLFSLTLPSSVTEIGESAFRGCRSLASLTLPSSVTEIGESAFEGCIRLASLTLPSSVTSIGKSAFEGCSGLTSIYVSWESPLSIDASTFKDANTGKCILYVPKGTYDDYWLSNWGIFENIVEYDATGIDHITTSGEAKEISRYAADGQRLEVPAKGLNIVKYSDGCVKKVVVQ